MAVINMKEKIKGLGSSVLGVIAFLVFLIIPFILLFGTLKVSEYLYPIISVLAGGSMVVFLLIVLPLSLFKSLQSHLAGASMVLSYIIGAAVFMFSFLTIFHYLGGWAFVLMFLFHVVSPIAAIGLFFKGQWNAGISLIIGLIFTYGIRFYGVWLATIAEGRMVDQHIETDDVIDVDGESEVIEEEPKQIEDLPENAEENNDENVRFDQ